MKKTKVMSIGVNMNTLINSDTWLCCVCWSGIGGNSIYCSVCKHWVHKSCSGISGKLVENKYFRCYKCDGLTRPIEGNPFDCAMLK